MKAPKLTQGFSDFDINNLDFKNAGIWHPAIKGIACAVVLLLVIFAAYYFHISSVLIQYDQSVKKEVELKKEYKSKVFTAANLGVFRKQMADMEMSFSSLVMQLPSDTEVAGLLEDITRVGLSSHLQIDHIKLQSENLKEFYVELPIQIQVQGSYHALGAFVSGVASLPRIVTVHDFDIKPTSTGELLVMMITAKTYRYINEGEQ